MSTDKVKRFHEEPELVKAHFDDLIKFGRYTVFLTVIYLFSLLAQSLQLLFMSFGGAQPNVQNLNCNLPIPGNLVSSKLTIEEACRAISTIKKGFNISCSINATYKYGSIFKDFDVECNPDLVRFSTSIQNVGLIFGTIISGYFANSFGRKKTYIAVLSLLMISLVVSTCSRSVMQFTVARFFVMFFTAGSHNVSHIFVLENLPIKWRSIVPSFLSYSLTFMFVAGLAYYAENWITLTYLSFAITLIPTILAFFSVETPSFTFSRANNEKLTQKRGSWWILSKKWCTTNLDDSKIGGILQEEKATKLRKAAKIAALRIETFCYAKKSIDFDEKWKNAAVQQRINEIATRRASEEISKKQSKISLMFPLLGNRRLLCFAAILSYSIIALSTTNYGILLGIDSLPGAISMNILISSVIAYGTNWTSILIELLFAKLNRPLWAGRRQMHIACASLTAMYLIMIFAVKVKGRVTSENETWNWIVRILVWMVIGAGNQLYIIHHVQSSETFPTPVRAVGCSIIQTANRVGTALGPLLLVMQKYGSYLPYLIMAAMFCVELFLYINYSYGCCRRKLEKSIIRETKGQPKPEFMPSQRELFQDHLKDVRLSDFDISFLK